MPRWCLFGEAEERRCVGNIISFAQPHVGCRCQHRSHAKQHECYNKPQNSVVGKIYLSSNSLPKAKYFLNWLYLNLLEPRL